MSPVPSKKEDKASGGFAKKLVFCVARCFIGAAVGYAFFEIYGLLAGAAIGLVSWPVVRWAGWVIIQLYGGVAEPEQPVHFQSWRKKKDRDKDT